MRRKLRALLGALCVACSACSPAVETPAAPVATPSVTPVPTTTRSPTDPTLTAPEPGSFRAAADAITASLLMRQPESVTELGAGPLIGFDADYLLDDVSAGGRADLMEAAADGLARLDELGQADLDEGEQISAAILRWYLDDIIAMAEYGDYENPVNFITGRHAGFAEFMADVHPVETEQDAENYVERLIAFNRQLADIRDELERRAELGLAPTTGSLQIARWQIGNAIGAGDPANHPLVADLRARIEAMQDENNQWAVGLVARAEAAVADLIVPGLEELDEVVQRIGGRSDQTPGATALPGGDEYYRAVLRHHLSLDLTPEQVHEIGLEQVDRLVGELTTQLEDLGYDPAAGLAEVMRQAAADAGAMPTTSEPERAAVLEATATTVEEASAVFDEMFTIEPEAAVEVVRPRPGREGGSGAYYRSPPLDGSRPGVYYLSLGGSEFPTLTMDTTTYHEAVPGHHFQLSVQRSLDDLPLHQRAIDFTGYVEGWALYAERLAFEAGLYDDNPLGNLGRLQMELLRAARMVVDTGIHWGGWSRDDGIGYLTDLGFSNARATSEVDRYIVWPGQAPAYMVGMLEILELRDRAQAELGDGFDLAGFHDALLRQGSVPLALLQDVVDTWIAAAE